MAQILRDAPVIMDLHRLGWLVLRAACLLVALGGGWHTVDGPLTASRLDGAHGLTQRNRYDLPITDILEEYLRIADDQGVCDIQLIFQLVICEGGLQAHAVGALEVGGAICRSICTHHGFDSAHSSDCAGDDRVLLLCWTIRIKKLLLL